MPDNYEPGALKVHGGDEITTVSNINEREWPRSIAHVRPSHVEWRMHSNARRLVACWNACQGIDTGDLEKGAVNVMEHMTATPDQRLQKRAEILAEILQGLADHDFGGRLHGWERIRAYDAICARARAVLASKS
jgi:hypothetical protein